MLIKFKDVIDVFENQILYELATLRDSHGENRADLSTKIREYLSDRFQGIMHNTALLFEFPKMEIKLKPIVKVESVATPPEANGTCTPGTSFEVKVTPVKRSNSESMEKSPKKQKVEDDSMVDGSANSSENHSANGEGSRTPVTRSHSKEISSVLFGFSFYCGNCDGESFESPEKVHEHWNDKHVHGEKIHPFTFRVSNLARCHYCEYPGAYGALRTHKCKERGSKPIVFTDIRDETQCGLCSFKGDNIVAHATAEHAVVSELKIHNPIAINEACLKELLEFDMHKKIKCAHCKNEFATEKQFVRHNQEHHPEQTPKKSRNFKPEPKLYLPCCNMTIDEKVFVFHFQNHPPNFACVPCNQSYPSLNDLVEHDKKHHGINDASEKRLAEFKRQLKKYYLSTEVRYPNGLVLNVQNLLATNHSKEPDFNAFIVDMARVKLEKGNNDSGSSSQAK